MGAYAYINGKVNCEEKLDTDIEHSLDTSLVSHEFWHRNADMDYLFSFAIKESRLPIFLNILKEWASIKTLDSVLEEWYSIEVYLLIKYESDDLRIDSVEIKNENILHRKTTA